jgi:hypothetical protein
MIAQTAPGWGERRDAGDEEPPPSRPGEGRHTRCAEWFYCTVTVSEWVLPTITR